jgi:hypothetical protein
MARAQTFEQPVRIVCFLLLFVYNRFNSGLFPVQQTTTGEAGWA